MSEKVVLDLNDLFPGRASLADVQEKVARWDVSAYRGKAVQMRGCSPTWAHLLVAGKLFEAAESVEFILDDGKAGLPVPIFKRDSA